MAVDPGPAAASADATRDLYEQYGRQIFAFTLSRLGNRVEAEDATQNTFLNAHRSLQRGVVPRAELTWLLKIAERVVGNRRRALRRRSRIEAPVELELAATRIARPASAAEELFRLDDALAALSPQQRRAVVLREWHGLSYHEISAELGISHAAVETLLFRARRVLAATLIDPDGANDGRRRRRLDIGALLSAAKGLLSGGSTAKLVGLVGAAAVGTIGVAGPVAPTPRAAPPAARAAATTSVARAPFALPPRHHAAQAVVAASAGAVASPPSHQDVAPASPVVPTTEQPSESPVLHQPAPPSEPTRAETPPASVPTLVSDGPSAEPVEPAPVDSGDSGPSPPPGQDPARTPPGQDPARTPPGQDPTRVPPGQDPTRTPPGQDPTRTQPGQDTTRTTPGQDPDRIPPGQDPDRIPPGQDPDRIPPGQDPTRIPTGQTPDVVPPGQSQDPDAAPPGQAADHVPPGQAKHETTEPPADTTPPANPKGNGRGNGGGGK